MEWLHFQPGYPFYRQDKLLTNQSVMLGS